jgi:hypothetical protein
LVIDRTLGSDGVSYEELSDTAARILVLNSLQLNRGNLRVPGFANGLTSIILIESYGTLTFGPNWTGGGGLVRVYGPSQTVEIPADGYVNRLDVYTTSTIINFNGTGTTTVNSLNIFGGTVRQNSSTLSVGAISAQSGSALLIGGSGGISTEAVEAYNGGRLLFGTGQIHIGISIRTGGTPGSVIDFSQASSLLLRRNGSSSSNTLFGVNTNTTVSFPPIPVYIDFRTSSILGTFNSAGTTMVFDRNGNQAFLSGVPLTFAGLTKIATSTQSLFLPSNVTTTITGTLTLQGSSTSSLLRVRSSLNTNGSGPVDIGQVIIDPLGPRVISFLEVSNNRNIHPTLIDATGQYAIDGGNVDGWFGLIDIINPTTPGSLGATTVTPSSARLLFGATSTDVNFLDYRIFYTTGTSSPSIIDSSLTSSTQSILGNQNYNGETGVTLNGLTRSSIYTANIWAYDEYGNFASGTEPITLYTLPNRVSDVNATNIQQRSLTINWNTNDNLPTTLYSITDTSDPSRSSGFFNGTSFDLVNLEPSREYTFTIASRDDNNRENTVTVGPFSTASAGGGLVVTPTPPPIGGGGGGGGGGGETGGGGGTETPGTTGRAMIINNDAPETLSRNVSLLMNVPTAQLVAISNLPDLADAVFEPYAETFSWTLTPGFGEKNVYARFRNVSGGILDSTDSIVYTELPTPPPVTPPPVQPPPPQPPTPPTTPPAQNPPPPTPPRVTPPPPSNSGGSGGGSTNPTPPPTTPSPGGSTTSPTSTSTSTTTPDTTATTTPTTTESGTIGPELPDFPTPAPEPVPPPSPEPISPTEEPSTEIANTPIERVVEAITAFQEQPEVVRAARVTAPVATTISAIAVSTSLWSILAPLVRFLFLQPLMFLGLRRREIWGEVYETEHKLPVDLAIVRLSDAATGKVVQTRVTDMHGRYLFTPKAGTYRIDVVKDGFAFPSHLLRHASADGRHDDLYYGEPIVTSTDGEPIAKNIGLDREGSTNSGRRFRSLTQPVRALQQGMAMAGAVATGVSFAATPNLKTFGYILLHVGLGFLFFRYAKPKIPKRMGIIFDGSTKQPIAHAVVRLYNESLKKLVDTKITNEKGEYVFLVGGGSYRIIVEKQGYRSSSTPIVLPESTEAGAITKNMFLTGGETHTTNDDEPKGPDTLPRINLMG